MLVQKKQPGKNPMTPDEKINSFLSNYDKEISSLALKLREVILMNLPGITEQVDLPAKMIHYVYGQRYVDLICALIPSKKGLKLGFNRGTQLPDPGKLLEGSGKISRYVVIKSEKQIRSAPIKKLIAAAFKLYKSKINTNNP